MKKLLKFLNKFFHRNIINRKEAGSEAGPVKELILPTIQSMLVSLSVCLSLPPSNIPTHPHTYKNNVGLEYYYNQRAVRKQKNLCEYKWKQKEA